MSSSLAIGPIARLRRVCYDVINQQIWSDSCLLMEEPKAELHYWRNVCHCLNHGRPIYGWGRGAASLKLILIMWDREQINNLTIDT